MGKRHYFNKGSYRVSGLKVDRTEWVWTTATDYADSKQRRNAQKHSLRAKGVNDAGREARRKV